MSIYATRAVTLEYQNHVGGGYEAARRDLTERLLPVVNGQEWPRYVELHVPASGVFENKHPAPVSFRAWIQSERGLLVVTKLERV